MRYTPLLISTLLITSIPLLAGLNRYSYLDKVGNWTIERKFEPDREKISCRASILKERIWFGSRIHLNKDGEVFIPRDLVFKYIPNESIINNVKRALEACRSGLIYTPLEFWE